jgi:hypothetical protein
MCVSTIGEARRAGWRITKRDGIKTRRGCGSGSQLDLDTMLCTHGRDFPLS